MAQWLRALAALSWDLKYPPSSHREAHRWLLLRESMTPSGFHKYAHISYIDRQTCREWLSNMTVASRKPEIH